MGLPHQQVVHQQHQVVHQVVPLPHLQVGQQVHLHLDPWALMVSMSLRNSQPYHNLQIGQMVGRRPRRDKDPLDNILKVGPLVVLQGGTPTTLWAILQGMAPLVVLTAVLPRPAEVWGPQERVLMGATHGMVWQVPPGRGPRLVLFQLLRYDLLRINHETVLMLMLCVFVHTLFPKAYSVSTIYLKGQFF